MSYKDRYIDPYTLTSAAASAAWTFSSYNPFRWFTSSNSTDNNMDYGDVITTAHRSYRGAKNFLRDLGFDQSSGFATKNVGNMTRGRKKWSLRKLLNGSVLTQHQVLGLRNWIDNTWAAKYLVSEHNLNGGYTSIGKATGMASKELPLHVYDLSTVLGTLDDTSTNFPLVATNQNADINARAWYLNTDSIFQPLNNTGSTLTPRWLIDRPDNTQLPVDDPTKIYMNSIDIKYQFFGSQKMPQEFDIMVIRITDPVMCPDYYNSLTDVTNSNSTTLKDFKTRWSKLIYSWCVSPMMRGLDEPGKPDMGPWFNVVAKKRVKIGERTQLDTVPRVQGSIHVRVNELHDHTWNTKNFNAPGEGYTSNALFYDQPAAPIDEKSNAVWQNKPYFTSRFYLVIRALGTVDTENINLGGVDTGAILAPFDDAEAPTLGQGEPVYAADNNLLSGAPHLPRYITIGTTHTEYNGSYDLIIKSKYSKLNGI